MGAEKLTSTITGVEMFRKILDRGAGITLVFFKNSKKTLKRNGYLCKVQLSHTLHLKLRFIS
jgi:translation elongation factor EF-Tu-like GTPase